jgi:Ca-activated chloride channel family protein
MSFPLLLLALPLLGQEPATEQVPTFRGGVTNVLVDALVLDGDGNPVPDLTAEDFEIYEDGVLQSVATFDVTDWTSYVNQRDEATPASDVNTYPRRFVLILNRQGARFDYLVRAKRGLMNFVVESMADGDEAMVVEIAHSFKVVQEFRSTKEETLQAVKSLSQMPFDYPMGAARSSQLIYQDLGALADALAALPGRKVVVLLSNELLTFAPAGAAYSDSGLDLKRTIAALNQANASVYTIDLRGVESQSSIVGGLSPLATETGGRYLRNQNSFERPLARIGRENQRYYLLSYVPTNSELDGSYRRIEVRVTRPDVEVIARQGYVARPPSAPVPEPTAEAPPSEPADEVSATPAVTDDLPLAVEVSNYLLPTGVGTVRLAVTIALPADLLTAEGDDERRIDLTVFDEAGNAAGTFEERVSLDHPYVIPSFDLAPGRYDVRMTLSTAQRELYSASTQIPIPTDLGERFGLSSIVPVVSPQNRASAGDGLPILPRPSLKKGENGYVLFQVFPGREDPSSRVHVGWSILDEDGQELRRAERDRPIDITQGRPNGSPIILQLPMSSLSYGTYIVEIRVEDRSRGRRATSAIEIRIR